MKNRLLFLGMMILSLNYVLYNTIGSFNGKNLLRIAAVLFILLHIIFNWRHISIKLQDIIIAVLLIIPFIVLPMNDKVINFGLILLLTISSRTSNYKEIIKNLFFISILSVLLVFIMNLSGIISNTAYTIGERTRYTFGFLNVNAFSLLLYSSLMLYILSRKKVELIHLIVMNIISVGFSCIQIHVQY